MKPQKNTIFCGGNLEVVSSWPSNFISAIVTDPPYGLGFMGKGWDTFKDTTQKASEAGYEKKKTKLEIRKSPLKGYASKAAHAGNYDYSQNAKFQQWFTVWAKAMLRITKPGGFLLCFGGTRTYHRLTCAIEDAGWEIRDCMMWLYGSGFPKSHNISKAIDKAKGVKPLGKKPAYGAIASRELIDNRGWNNINNALIMPKIQTDLAQLWDGYGTALKPAWEPIIVAMKPLDGTFAHNAEAHGVAGLNIDGGRIGTGEDKIKGGCVNRKKKRDSQCSYAMGNQEIRDKCYSQGRWPANLILDESSAEMLDEQTGISKSNAAPRGGQGFHNCLGREDRPRLDGNIVKGHNDSGGASRFFYCAKTSRRERNMGLDDQSGKKVNDGRETPIDNPYQRGETIRKNTHPTVKPLALMKYLCTLLKMPGQDQIILDPFLGSGTTGIACKELGINFIGIEKEQEYCEIAVKRIAAVPGQEITLHTETPPIEKPVAEVAPNLAESRQRIINAASAALREKRK